MTTTSDPIEMRNIAITVSGTQLTRGSDQAAGYDLRTRGAVRIEHGQQVCIDTGTTIAAMPRGWYGRIAARSGVAFREVCFVNAGVIDSDYRGEIKVLMINLSGRTVQFSAGERIAQIVFEVHATPVFTDAAVLIAGEIAEGIRGAAGFGSSGTH